MSRTLDQAIPETRSLAGRQGPDSLGELAKQLDIALKEKREIASQLNEAFAEIAAINKLYQQRRTQFESDKDYLISELDHLREQVREYSKREENKLSMSGGMKSLLETRERLVREEFERKFQELAIIVKRQRQKYDERLGEMKMQMAGCICRGRTRGR